MEERTTHVSIRAKSTKSVKNYDAIKLSSCCGTSYDFSGYIKHPLYDKCVVDKVEYNTTDQVLEVSLVSVSECSNIPIPADDDEGDTDPTCPARDTYSRSEGRAYTSLSFGKPIVLSGLYLYYNDGKCGEYEYGPIPA